MQAIDTLVTVIHVIICIFLILVILLQAGKGAGMGVGILGGASQTVFGGRGASTFLGKATAVMAFLFMATSMTLAYRSSRQDDPELKARAEKAKKEAEERLSKERERVESLRKQMEEAAKKGDLKPGAATQPTSAPTSAPTAAEGLEAPAPSKDRTAPQERPLKTAPTAPQSEE